VAKSQLTVGVRIDGVRETLAAFRALPKDASKELRETSLELSRKLALSAQAAGVAEGQQAALVAKTVRAVRDRVPAVVAGGVRRLGSRKAPAWKLLFGAEFGSMQYRQFPRLHTGRAGIWFFPTIEREATATAREWRAAADRIIRAFGKGS
jgi:hypothetical protein